METRANYVLIGAFSLAGFAGILGFFLWFAQVELDRQFAYYDVRFDSVSGLSRASDVRFSGLPVGQVVDVRLAPERDGTVLVRLEVTRETPVRVDSVATIESQGVTGVSFVGISSGAPDAAFLTIPGPQGYPEITPGRSVLQTLSEDAPEILEEALGVVRRVSDLLNAENVSRVQAILTNLEASSGNLGQALDDFAVVTSVVATASTDIANFTVQLDPAITAVTNTLAVLDGTLESITALADRIKTTLDEGDAALASGRIALDTAAVFMTDNLPVVVQDLTATTAELRHQVEVLTAAATDTLGRFGAAGDVATARLTEAAETLAAADAMIARATETLATVDRAGGRIETLVAGDGAALVAEARATLSRANDTIARIGAVAETDLPAIVADIRGATATAARVIEEVGADMSAASGRIDGLAEGGAAALAQVTETFANANVTLTAINDALSLGEATLAAATRAFDGADRVIDQEIGTIAETLRGTMGRLDEALAQVSADLPGITDGLRAAATSASEAFEEFGGIVASSGAPIRAFAAEGLPQYTRLAAETRALVSSLERLTRTIERDSARFFLNRQNPEFTR